jgi:hypothetical protein
MLTRGTLELFITTWNTLFCDGMEHYVFKIMLTCGTDVGL